MPVSTSDLDLSFPDTFRWGAATSAHQVEGGNTNDWSEWEKVNAQRLANAAESKFASWLVNWEDIKSQAQDPQNYISAQAADHYHLYKQDLDLLQELGMNSYRFSIEWSRIEPTFGKFDQAELDHYIEVIAEMKSRGVEPFITLWHWTNPVWFRDRGGWLNPDAPRYFADFVGKAVGSGIDADYWIVLNEPEVYARQSYLVGDWPPQYRSTSRFLTVRQNLLRAHNYAAEAIKQIKPGTQVGIAHHAVYMQPYPSNLINRWAVKPVNWWWNHQFLNAISHNLDFIGLNYYFHRQVNFVPYISRPTVTTPQSDLGWSLNPDGIYHTLMDLKQFGKPLYVTEHGLADAKDEKREWYIRESLHRIRLAMQHGADVRGYFHWSLLDNFEWDKGFWPRFGLAEVDFATQKRTLRPSAYKLRDIILGQG